MEVVESNLGFLKMVVLLWADKFLTKQESAVYHSLMYFSEMKRCDSKG